MKELTGEGFGHFCLAHASGPQEEEGAQGAVGVRNACLGAANDPRDRRDGFGLPNDARAEVLLEVEEAVLLASQKALKGDARPAGDDIGDGLSVNRFPDDAVFRGVLLKVPEQFLLAVLELGKDLVLQP